MIRKIFKVLLKPLMNENGWLGSGGGGGYNAEPKSAGELEMERLRNVNLNNRTMGLAGGEGAYARMSGLNKNEIDTTKSVDNPEYADIQNQIKTLEEQSKNAQMQGIDPRGGSATTGGSAITQAQLRSLYQKLSNTPKTITTGEKSFTYTPMTEAERITPILPNGQPNPNYNPSYAQQVASQTSFDTNLQQAGTEVNAMSADLETLIGKFNQFDTDTKSEILKQAGYTDEQAGLLLSQINTLKPLQTQAAGLTTKSGLTLEDLMAGKMPENLKPYYTDAMQNEQERLARMGVGRDARLEAITRAGTKTALDLMTPYQSIYNANMNNTMGLTSGIAGYGQTDLANKMSASDATMRYKAMGSQNWGNVPILRGNLATQRMGLANAQGQRATYYNQLDEQNRNNLRTMSNWYGQ